MKILFIIDEMEDLTAGGTERQILHHASVCRDAGLEPQILTLRGTEWLTSDTCGCPVRHASVKALLSPAGLAELLRVFRWMRSQRFDLVQTFFAESNLIGPLLAWLARVPVRVGSRRNLGTWMSRKFVCLQRFSNRFATRLLANSEAVKIATVQLEQVPNHKVGVVYNGVETTRFAADPLSRARVRKELRIADSEIVVGSTANFVAVKCLELLLEAAASLASPFPNVRFLLTGDGPERERLESLRERLGLTERVSFLGRIEDIPAFLSACDVFVLTSSHEGFSNGLLEAMAAGLPCIATDVGGNREALGASGILVPPKNAIALSEAIASVLRDPARRIALSELARQRVTDEFSASSCDRRLLTYYFTLVDGADGRSLQNGPESTLSCER